jgi:2,3-bisphosphoglycerate-dependent phosphoglycerate mutase
MGIQIVFETHSITEDNENNVATGWLDGRLSERGRLLASELGARRREDGIQAVFTSDLERALETARIAFANGTIPILTDWRLRECDHGVLNGHSVAEVHENRLRYLNDPYPGGESWTQAIERVGRFLPDLHLRWDHMRILVIGHSATRYAFEHLFKEIAVETLLQSDFVWKEGWEYHMP